MKSIPINILGVGAVGLMLAAVYSIGVLPLLDSGRELRSARAETDYLTQQLEHNRTNNSDLQQRIDTISSRMHQKYSIHMPAGQPIMETLSDMLDKHGLELQNLRQESMRSGRTASVDVQIDGQYDALMRFIYDIGHLDFPARVTSLHVTPRGSETACSCRCQVDFFPSQLVSKIDNGDHHDTAL